MSRVFLGSVAERTLRLAPCPILMVSAREEDEGS
jgi:nucleotide-binding universal stress UspA family protein